MAYYKGFSTITGKTQFSLVDIELVKQDLLNHFYIRKGEKLMNPNYGSSIWSLLFDPFDAATKQAIQEDVKQIVASDPRLNARRITVTEYEQGIQLEIDLVFVQTNQADTLRVRFDKNSQSITRS